MKRLSEQKMLYNPAELLLQFLVTIEHRYPGNSISQAEFALQEEIYHAMKEIKHARYNPEIGVVGTQIEIPDLQPHLFEF